MCLRVALAVTLAATLSSAKAATLPVCDSAGLVQALGRAAAGDTVLLEPGVYSGSALSCAASGTQGAPIIVRSRVPRAARLRLTGPSGFVVTGDHWHFEDLVIEGACEADAECSNGLLVSGQGFELRGSMVRDFDHGVRAAWVDLADGGVLPAHRGLIEKSDFDSTHFRRTMATLSQISVVGGDDWVVRDNFIVGLSFAPPSTGNAFAVSFAGGGKRALAERNVVLCRSAPFDASAVEIGLSIGAGDLVGPPCAAPGVRCPADQTDAIFRNNVVVDCADVGVYVANSVATKVLSNTLIEQYRVDFRYPTTTADVAGNLLSSVLFRREGGTFVGTDNVTNVPVATFDTFYPGWRSGDLQVKGDVSSLVGVVAPRSDVTDDLCGRPRPAGNRTVGALEHSLGNCVTGQRLTASDAPAAAVCQGESRYVVGCGCAPGNSSKVGWLVLAWVALRRRVRSSELADISIHHHTPPPAQ